MAATWYRKAAERGNAGAQYSLGLKFEYGDGVPQDYVLAHMWLNLAGSRFREEDFPDPSQKAIVVARDSIAARMTPSQIEEAQRLAREWAAKASLSPR